ncbi:MAG: hypothetical protein IJU70_00140 [Lentisphaeria bacterium]|nr:hypothetical protein [Lentisphaeria bacterium]
MKLFSFLPALLLAAGVPSFAAPAEMLLPVEKWKAYNYRDAKAAAGVFHGTTVFVPRKTSPFLFSPPVEFKGRGVFAFEMRSGKAGTGRLFFRSGTEKFSDDRRRDFRVDGRGKWKNYRLDLPELAGPQTFFRLDSIFADGVAVAIRNIRIMPPAEPKLTVRPSRDRFRGRPSIVFDGTGETITLPPGPEVPVELPRGWLNFPSGTGRYKIVPDAGGPLPEGMKLEVFPFDAFKKALAPASAPFLGGEFVLPPAAAGFDARLVVPPRKHTLILRSLRLEPVRAPGDIFGPWPAQWIWLGGEKAKSHQAEFQTKFTLEEKPRRAVLQIDADDVIERIVLNGREISPGPNASDVFSMDEHEVAPLLVSGENTLFLAVRDLGGARGVHGELILYFPGKKVRRIGTGENFQARLPGGAWEPAVSRSQPLPLRSVEGRFIGGEPPAAAVCAPRYRTPELPAAKIRYGNNNIPLLEVDGRTRTLNHLWSDMSERWIKNVRDAGIHQYWISSGKFGRAQDGKYDWSHLDALCRKVIACDPEALLLVEIPVGTSIYENRAMEKWNEEHPGELVADESGNTKLFIFQDKRRISAASFASKLWQEEAKRIMRSAVEHVKKSPYAGHVIGFFPMAGLGHEWQYYGAHNRLFVDYSRPFREGFAAYRVRRRGEKCDTAMPDKVEREAPEPSEKVRDMRDYFSELVSGILLDLAREVKLASGGRSLFGTYYGYPLYIARPDWNETGGFMLKRLLESPDVDLLVSIFRYDNRQVGRESGTMTVPGSFRLRGKAAVLQADHRTHLAVRNVFGEPADVNGSIEVVKREIAWCAVLGAGFEFGYFNHGWIAGDPRLIQVVSAGEKLMRQLSVMPPSSPVKKVALVFDEDEVRRSAQRSKVHFFAREQLKIIPHGGFAFDLFLKEKPEVLRNYPLVICMNFRDEAWASVLRSAGCRVENMSAAKPLDAEAWQKLAAESGIHIFNENCSDITLAGNGVIAVHTAENGGKRTLRPAPGTKRLRDVFTGKTIPVRDGGAEAELSPLSTGIWLEER